MITVLLWAWAIIVLVWIFVGHVLLSAFMSDWVAKGLGYGFTSTKIWIKRLKNSFLAARNPIRNKTP